MTQRKNWIVVAFTVLVAVAGLMPCAEAQSEKLGLLRISAEYPIQVPLSYSFSVKLKVEYAFRDYFEIHAAVYDGRRGAFARPLWEGEPQRLIDVGELTYDVKLKSPSQMGQWFLTAYAFFQDASGSSYFTDYERGPGFFEMSIKIADDAKLTLRAPYGNIPVHVDGVSYLTDGSGVFTRQFKVLTGHSVEVPRNVSIAEGWRIVFRSWNGTDPSNPKRLIIATDTVLVMDFGDEFYLDLVSDAADVKGSGWYPSGAIANFSAPQFAPKGWEGVLGVQWRFIGWSGDVESASPNERIVMDRPHRIAANWTVDYQQSILLMILIAVVVAGGLVVLSRRRPVNEPSSVTASPAVRTYCMFCGSNIDPDARFCSKCGKSQISSS